MGSIKNIAVLLSGHGSVCSAIHKATQNGPLKDVAKLSLVVSSNLNSDQVYLLNSKKYNGTYISMPWKDPDQWHFQMYELMEWHGIDLICLAGFVKKIDVWPEWTDRILNTHPSLLPKFGGKGMYGLAVHEAVLASDEKETGCTIHVVNNEYDSGRILAQSKFELSEMKEHYRKAHYVSNWVKSREYDLYPQVIADYLKEQYPKS